MIDQLVSRSVSKLKQIEVIELMQGLNSETLIKLKPQISVVRQRQHSSQLARQTKTMNNPYSNSTKQLNREQLLMNQTILSQSLLKSQSEQMEIKQFTRVLSSKQISRNNIIGQLDALKAKCSQEQQSSTSTLRQLDSKVTRINSEHTLHRNLEEILEKVSHVPKEEVPMFYLDYEEEVRHQTLQVQEVVKEHESRLIRPSTTIESGKSRFGLKTFLTPESLHFPSKAQLVRDRKQTIKKLEIEMSRVRISQKQLNFSN